MAYDAIHNIESNTQTHTRTTPGEARIEQHKTTYDFSYAYTSSHPHAPTNIGDRTFRYDDNGNQLGWDHDRSGQRRRTAASLNILEKRQCSCVWQKSCPKTA